MGRPVEVVDAELRVLAAYRAACAGDGDPVKSTKVADRLLDERNSCTDHPWLGNRLDSMTDDLFHEVGQKASRANDILARVDENALSPAEAIAFAQAQALVGIAFAQQALVNHAQLQTNDSSTFGQLAAQQADAVNRIAEHVEKPRLQ